MNFFVYVKTFYRRACVESPHLWYDLPDGAKLPVIKSGVLRKRKGKMNITTKRPTRTRVYLPRPLQLPERLEGLGGRAGQGHGVAEEGRTGSKKNTRTDFVQRPAALTRQKLRNFTERYSDKRNMVRK